jgi:hypothetical protein
MKPAKTNKKKQDEKEEKGRMMNLLAQCSEFTYERQ